MNRRQLLFGIAGGVIGCAAPRAPGPASVSDVAAFRAARRFAVTASGRIAYVERGRGPAALFLHGLPLNGFQWRGALDRLGSIRRCVAPDLMGLGSTEVSDTQSLAPEAQVLMLVELLDALAIASVDLVASDSGGAVAQLFVAHHGERVRTLLLTNGDVHDDSPPPALQPVIAAARAGTFADEVLAPQVADPALARAPDGLGGICYNQPIADATVACYLAPLVSSPRRKAQVHRYIVELARNPLLAIEPALRRSRAPMRVVWGTGDTLFSQASPAWLARTFPQSRGIRLVDGAKLFFPEEQPDLIAEEARRLWTT